MNAHGWLQVLVTYGLVLLLVKPLGGWLLRVLERDALGRDLRRLSGCAGCGR